MPNPDGTPSLEEREGSENFVSNSNSLFGADTNNVEAVDSSFAASPTEDGGDDNTERRLSPREREQAQDNDNYEEHSPREEAPGVLDITEGRGEEPMSVNMLTVSPPSSELPQDKKREEERRKSSGPSPSSSAGGGVVDAMGVDQHEPRHFEENPQPPVSREAHPSGFSSEDGGHVDGGGVVVDPETSIADETIHKDPERNKKTSDCTQPAEGDVDANGSGNIRSRRSGSGRAVSALPTSADLTVGNGGRSNDDDGGRDLEEAPEKCHIG